MRDLITPRSGPSCHASGEGGNQSVGQVKARHEGPVITLTEQERKLIRTAIDDLATLAVLYERRLIFKGRYRREAMLAAASARNAKAILRV